jgi:hypothetical protein
VFAPFLFERADDTVGATNAATRRATMKHNFEPGLFGWF